MSTRGVANQFSWLAIFPRIGKYEILPPPLWNATTPGDWTQCFLLFLFKASCSWHNICRLTHPFTPFLSPLLLGPPLPSLSHPLLQWVPLGGLLLHVLSSPPSLSQLLTRPCSLLAATSTLAVNPSSPSFLSWCSVGCCFYSDIHSLGPSLSRCASCK